MEPTRKKARYSELNCVSDGEVHPIPDVSDQQWLIRSSHHTSPGELDLSQFVNGAPIPATKSLRGVWIPFSGRPNLVKELLPHLKTRYANRTALSFQALQNSLRVVWRYLDRIDPDRRIFSVADLNELHGAQQYRDGIDSRFIDDFLSVANMARQDQGMSPLYWLRFRKKPRLTDVPAKHHIAAVVSEIKQSIKFILNRWSDADEATGRGEVRLESDGSITPLLKWTEEDQHATYRAAKNLMGIPCPSRLNLFPEGRDKAFSRHFEKTVMGLYPCFSDVQAFFHMFIARTGWNASTALGIDIGEIEATIVPHPTSNAHHIVFGVKPRAGYKEQFAIGMNKSLFSPGSLLRTLYDRTLPVRAHLRNELAAELSKIRTRDIEKNIERLRSLIRSPWLYVRPDNGCEIRCLDFRNYSMSTRKESGLTAVINRINQRRQPEDQVPFFTLGDFRDGLISYVYEVSGYDWMVAKYVAGHSSTESLKAYLRKLRFKMRGENAVFSLQTALWQEIRERRVVDPAVLHALVQRGEITDDQRRRWLIKKDQTRLGMGCKDIRNPPRHIEPDRRNGSICRTQRCTICEHGVVLQESIDGLSRRLCELRLLRTQIPLLTWNQSNFADELEATKLTLDLNFSAADVTKAIQYWDLEITSGRHRPVFASGEYLMRR